jgi:hypothetical protein
MINPANSPNSPLHQTSSRYRRQVSAALAGAKKRLISHYEQLAPGKSRRIRHAVDEAEILAWALPFPHLFLPDLAELQMSTVLAPNERAATRVR